MAFEKTFFCSHCGARYHRKNICDACGFEPQSKEPYGEQPALGAAGVGWSDRVNDPLFSCYQKNNRIYRFIFAAFLSIMIPAILFLTKDLSWDSDGQTVLWVIVGMYFISAFFSSLKTMRKQREWEVIEDKRCFRIRSGDTKYVLSVRLNDNTNKERSYIDDPVLYDYFRIGDTIRSHQTKNLRALEKCDTSLDEILFCPSFAYLCDARADTAPPVIHSCLREYQLSNQHYYVSLKHNGKLRNSLHHMDNQKFIKYCYFIIFE